MEAITSEILTSRFQQLLSSKTNISVTINEVLPSEFAKAGSLVFIPNKELFLKAISKNVTAFIMTEKLFKELEAEIPSNVAIWTTAHIQQAMSQVLQIFDKKTQYIKAGIHPTASIHPTAKISPSTHIGAYAVIEAHAIVGDDTVIFPHVYVGPYCEVGRRCYIAPHVTIGSDGFGFFTDKSFTHHKIPQIGKVVIEDDCEFGSHCAIDRATLTETRIKKGSKFDNFCHIAHNVQFGENAIVAAGFIVAGSTIIGKNLMTSGGVHVLGHLNIADNVILSARAGAMQSIEKSGMYGGFPLEPHKESIKTHASIPKIKKMRKQIHKILKHLNLTEEETGE